jgi:N-acetylmuramoyl-L-alanine amidase
VNSGELKDAQQKLKDDGDYTGTVDGKFGPLTAQALRKYQQSNGLRQTGRLDAQTASKLGVASSGGSGSSMSPTSSRNSSGTSSSGQKPPSQTPSPTGGQPNPQ